MTAAVGSLMTVSGIGARSGQLFQQHLGLLQVDGVKALGEPVVDWRQELSGFGPLALLLPQPAQTHGRPQL
jgi:hypothetical protein